MKHTLTLLAALLLGPLAAICGAAESPRPVAKPNSILPAKADLPDVGKYQSKGYNVLFIAVDDLNDWVGCLGGNPQAITPNMDRLATQQAMVMNKAYCASTVCCPSRSALLTGKRAASTGVYGNTQNLKNAAKAKDVVTLPEYFGKNGYFTLSAGKIFHKHATAAGLDEGQWAFQEFAHPGGTNKGMLWEESPSSVLGAKAQEKGQDKSQEKGEEKEVARWGACKAPVEETKDYLACKWAADQLQRDFEGKPFFLALGISKPHLAWIVPQQFFDLYPLEKIIPVEIFRDDLDDIVRKDGKPIFKSGIGFFPAIDKANLHKQAQRAYLASVSYVDYCLGVLLEALGKSKYADNTIIMIWGDHGWHLSEKMKYGKTDLWEESDRVPFIVRVPGLTPPGFKCEGVVNLLDTYPTLVELCGLAGSSTLSWSASNFVGLAISPTVGSVTSLTTNGAGSVVVSPASSTTYTLTATNLTGSASAPATVTVQLPVPVISSFAATPALITNGQSSTLAWSVTGADSLSLSPGIGNVTGLTSTNVTPTNNTTYVLTASNGWGTVQAQTQVLLNKPKPNFLFIAIDDLKSICGFMSENPGNFLSRIYPDPVKRAQIRGILTPNIDALAASSVGFHRAFCAASVCRPSRTALMTGYRPNESQVTGNANLYFRDASYPLSLRTVTTLPGLLMQNGYYAVGSGKIIHGDDDLETDYTGATINGTFYNSWSKWFDTVPATGSSGTRVRSPWSPPGSELDFG